MKPENRAKLNARAESALQNLYHNATPTYPRELYSRSDDYFESWFGSAAEFEIEYLQDGGSTPGNYAATLAHSANGGKLKSEKARRYYVSKGMRDRDLERADCGMLTGWRVLELAAGNTQLRRKLAKHGAVTRHNALWECITDYGKLYQWGRGGRTLAPGGLIKQGGGSSFGIREEYGANMNAADCTRLIQIVELFNHYVTSWCAGVPEMWREHCAEEDAKLAWIKRETTTRKAKETRERRYWEARDTCTA